MIDVIRYSVSQNNDHIDKHIISYILHLNEWETNLLPLMISKDPDFINTTRQLLLSVNLRLKAYINVG